MPVLNLRYFLSVRIYFVDIISKQIRVLCQGVSRPTEIQGPEANVNSIFQRSLPTTDFPLGRLRAAIQKEYIPETKSEF
jgi:hypothetical protein